jgi:hypothetical protein
MSQTMDGALRHPVQDTRRCRPIRVKGRRLHRRKHYVVECDTPAKLSADIPYTCTYCTSTGLGTVVGVDELMTD